MGSHKIHLVCWRSLSRPRHLGSWGIKRLRDFNRSLCAKSFWRVLFDTGLWGGTIQEKYLKGIDPTQWLQSFVSAPGNYSAIWRSLLKTYLIIKRSLCEEVDRRTLISVGVDPILGMGDHYCLSRALIQALHDRGLYVLKQMTQTSDTSADDWFTAADLGLSHDLGREWEFFRLGLVGSGIAPTDHQDRVVWSTNAHTGSVTTSLTYDL